MFVVTLKQLRDNKACIAGYNKVVCMLSGKEFNPDIKTYIRFKYVEPISLIDICQNNGVDDALWATRCLDMGTHSRDLRLFAVWCARQVEHLLQDERSKHAIDVAERFANGEATEQELEDAKQRAVDADDDYYGNYYSDAYGAAAYAVGSYTTVDADAARTAAMAAASADVACRSKQAEMFIKMCKGEAPWQVNTSVK